MNNNKITHLIIGTGIGIAGTIIATALITKHKLEKSKIIIDASEKMPAPLRNMIHNAKILPIEIQTKTLLDMIRGTGETKTKAEETIKSLSQYIVFKFK